MSKFKMSNKVAATPATPEESPAVEETVTTPEATEPQVIETVTAEAPIVEEAPIETTPESAPAPVVEASTPAPVVAEERASSGSLEDRMAQMLSSGTALEKVVVETLNDYTAKMKPGLVLSPDQLNQNQLQLWRLLRLVIESESDFQSTYTLIIDFARAHKDDVFHDRYLYRGMDNISLDKNTTTYFMGSLNVIKLAATSKNKQEAMAQVDLNRVMNEHVFSEAARNRVMAYYS